MIKRYRYFRSIESGHLLRVEIPFGVKPKRFKNWLIDLNKGFVVNVSGHKQISETQFVLAHL
jgi:hypothetical protein